MSVILSIAALISTVLVRSRSSCITNIECLYSSREILTYIYDTSSHHYLTSREDLGGHRSHIRSYNHPQIALILTSTRCCGKGCISEIEIQFGVSVNRRCMAACFQQLQQRQQKEEGKSVDMFQVCSYTLPLLQCQTILKFVRQRIPTPNNPEQHNCRPTSITTRYL